MSCSPPPGDLGVVFEELLTADVETADRSRVAALVSQAQRVRNYLDAFDLRCISRNRALRPEPTERGARDRDRNLLTGPGRRGSREARAAADRATTSEQVPELGAALSDGAVNAGHLDAFNRASAGVDDATRERLTEHGDELSAAAAAQSVDEFERTVRAKVRELSADDGAGLLERQRSQRRCTRHRDPETGLCTTSLVLDPITDEQVWNVFDTAIRRAQGSRQHDDGRTWDQFVADVVVDVLTGGLHVETGIPEITVIVDLATMQDGPHRATLCETADGALVPVDTLDRLSCDAHLSAAVLNGPGVPLDLGRSVRTATREQRRLLRVMYRTCGWHGCTVRFDRCRIHHVVPWSNGGPTDIANLLPLCAHHHHVVHEGGWTLSMTSDRVVTIVTPLGSLHARGNTADRSPPPTSGPAPCRVRDASLSSGVSA